MASSVGMCGFDEPVKSFPVDLVKMVFIHFQFYLVSAAGYFSRDCNKPVNKCLVFLFFKFAFLLGYHYQYVVGQNIQLPENVVCPKVIGKSTSCHSVAF